MVLDYLIDIIRLIDSFLWENKLIICSLLLLLLLVCEIFNYYSIKKNRNIMLRIKIGNLSSKEKEFILRELSIIENLVYYSNNFIKEDYMERFNDIKYKIKFNKNYTKSDIDYLNRLLKVYLDSNLLPGIMPKKFRYKINGI